MGTLTHRPNLSAPIALLGILALAVPQLDAQESLIVRTGPPAADDLETDTNKDGIPDGWYNARDMKWMKEGGQVGPHFVRFEATKPGRPARLSRAFGVDGR